MSEMDLTEAIEAAAVSLCGYEKPCGGCRDLADDAVTTAAPIIARQVARAIEARILLSRDALPDTDVGERMSPVEAAEYDTIGGCARIARSAAPDDPR